VLVAEVVLEHLHIDAHLHRAHFATLVGKMPADLNRRG
jgi:hypothetical protein